MERARLFGAEAILLLTTVLLLSLAEGTPIYLLLTLAGVLVGWLTTVHRDRPLIGPIMSRLFIIAAFVFLVFEYSWLIAIPVVALSHFMILVCICKLLQKRTLRDDAQVFVLTLLLLVVVAIVSGNLLFPAAVTIFLIFGIDGLIRFFLRVESERIEAKNRAIHPLPSVEPAGDALAHPLRGTVLTAVVSGVVAGIAIFLLFPRVGAGMFGRLEGPGGGKVITGFASSLNFSTIGPITESDRPVMRVVIETDPEHGDPIGEPMYFRGTVLDQYGAESPSFTWEWKRISGRGIGSRRLATRRGNLDGTIDILPQFPPGDDTPMVVQHYRLEPTDVNFLFTTYPALELQFDAGIREPEVRKWIEDQVLQVQRMPPRGMQYTITSPVRLSESVIAALELERKDEHASQPDVLRPRPSLPREREIMNLIRRVAGEPGSTPQEHWSFVKRVEGYLRSSEFSYTLEPPTLRPGTEPVGHFLLESRRGHCEYFASAMAVMCQLSGVPARVVSGYLGTDYNPVGHFYIVRQKHAHSWVEVYIPGMDWVTCDSTPAAQSEQIAKRPFLDGLTRYFDYLQFQWATGVVTYDADRRRELFNRFEAWLTRPAASEDTMLAGVWAFIRELFGWRLQLNWRERLIYWVFSLLVVTLVALLGYVVTVVAIWLSRRMKQRLDRLRTRQIGAAEFYERYCRKLEDLGLQRRRDQTPAEFADELAASYPALADAPALVHAYYEVIFGGRRLLPTVYDRLEQFLMSLQQLERPQLSES